MRVCIQIEDFLLFKVFFLLPESVTRVRDIPVNSNPTVNGRRALLPDATVGYSEMQHAAFKGC